MKKKAVAIASMVVVLAFLVFFVPIQTAVAPDGCAGCYVHFQRSISCSVFGFRVGYYAGTGLSSDCCGPIIP
jgi:membrane-bound acyltransferase YfiQ involved in biofilm formation